MDQDFDIVEQVQGDTVEISQGGAGVVEATTVNVNQGGIQHASTQHLTVTQGGIMIAEAGDVSVTMGGVGFLTADTVEFEASGAGIMVADTVKASDHSTIGVLFAGTVEGNPTIHVDGRKAIAAVAACAAFLIVLKRVVGRR
jgi:hypothetical protein